MPLALVKRGFLLKTIGFALIQMWVALGVANGQGISTEKFDYSKKIKYELGLFYTQILMFGKVHPEEGTYHPLVFKHPNVHTYEVDFSVSRKHLIAESYFKTGNMIYYLHFTEPVDSFFMPYYAIPEAVIDTFQFYNSGIRVGRIGSIQKQFQYAITLGLDAKYIPNSFIQYIHSHYIPWYTDTSNQTVYYTERFRAKVDMFLLHHLIYNFQINLKIKYPITKQLLVEVSGLILIIL